MRECPFYIFLYRSIFTLWIASLIACNNESKSEISRSISPPEIVKIISDLEILEDSILSAKVDSIFHRALLVKEMSGASVSIINGHQILLQKAYGYSDARSKTYLTPLSIFRIGSVSKSLTGILSGILFQQGKIDYSEKVSTYDQDCSLYDAEYSAKLNLGNLLSHTSGLPYHSYTNLIEYGIPIHKIVCKFNEIKNLEPPGSVYSYQNAAFAESGKILSSKLKVSIIDLFKNLLFDPLEMESASLTYKDLKKSKDLAKPHKKIGGKWVPQPINKKYYNAIPAGGINANIIDMTKIMNLMLGNVPSILSVATIDTITKPRIDTKVKYRYYKKWADFDHSYYGYGWRIHTFDHSTSGDADTLVHHGGQVNNYRSEIAIDKKEKIAICVLFNSYTPLANTIIPELLSIVKDVKKGPPPVEESL